MAILIPNFELAEKIGRRVELRQRPSRSSSSEGSSRFGESFAEAIKHAAILVNGRSVNLLKGGKTPLGKEDLVWLVRPSGGG